MSESCSSVAQDLNEPIIGSASVAERWIFVGRPKGQWPLRPGNLPELQPLLEWATRYDTQVGGKTTVRFVNAPLASNGSDIWLFPNHLKLSNIRFEQSFFSELESLFSVNTSHRLTAEEIKRTVVVCTHGKYDQCCAAYGQAVFKALRASPLQAQVLEASHLGGHRFASTLIDFTPGQPGRMYGGIREAHVSELVKYLEAHKVWLPYYRGRVDLKSGAQVAEQAALKEGAHTHISVESIGDHHYKVQWRTHTGSKTLDIKTSTIALNGVKSCGNPAEAWTRIVQQPF